MTLVIKTETNEPEVLSHEEIDWVLPHGTRIELEFKSTMQAKKKLLEYLNYTSVVNPHAHFRVEIDDESFTFDRVSNDDLICPISHQTESVRYRARLPQTNDGGIRTAVKGEVLIEIFSNIGEKTALEICTVAKLDAKVRVNTIQLEQINQLLDAMQTVKIPAPPASQCLSPIT